MARQGHEVTILDPSRTMLQEADRKLASEGDEVRRRVRLVEGGGEEAPRALDEEAFEAVLCHGVMMYLDDPCPMVRALAVITRPRAGTSVRAKNASAPAMRSALEGRYRDALAALEADRDLSHLGTVTSGGLHAPLAHVGHGGCGALSFYLLSFSMRSLPVGTACAV